VIKAFIETGGDFIDTANVYCLDDNDIGHNERLIHEALSKLNQLDKVKVATKGGLTRPNGAWERDARPERLRTACLKSLSDLQIESIFLYHLHAPDPNVPFMDSVGELIRLKEEGKIQHIGLSNVNQSQLKTALTQTPIVSVQNRCNPLAQRDLYNGLVNFCQANQITYIPYSPLGGREHHTQLETLPIFKELSLRYQVSVYVIALAWLLQKEEYVLPIPGASHVASVRDSAKAIETTLDPIDIKQIDSLVGIKKWFYQIYR
jgi:aryl-alcohol dehydrogenase-like predicted oxidoreductase